MRLNINLATKPYLDVRRILLQWGGLVLLLAACTAGLIWKTVTNWQQVHESNAKIAVLQREIAALDRQHDEAVAMLGLPQNVPVITTSKFLNGLIARKSFSWTRVFMQLEQIMPPRLHVVSISPELQPATNTVEMHLTVAGTSRDAAVELVKRLEQSPSFRDARIVEEREIQPKEDADSVRNVNADDTVQFHLMAVYVPVAGGATENTQPADKASASAQSKPSETRLAQAEGGAR